MGRLKSSSGAAAVTDTSNPLQTFRPELKQRPAMLRLPAVGARRPAPPPARSAVITASSAPGPQGPVELPSGGGVWWAGRRDDWLTPTYGDTFTLLRARVGGEGLVRYDAPPPPAVYAAPPRRAAPPRARAALPPPAGLDLALAGLAAGVVIDTEAEVVAEDEEEMDDAAAALGPDCLKIVPLGGARPAPAAPAAHPRRTQRLRYTCNLCRQRNAAAVNPAAWARGSVFARCAGCDAVHKLVDHLRIFDEAAPDGVFPPRALRASFPQVQSILDGIARRRAEGGAVAPPPDDDE